MGVFTWFSRLFKIGEAEINAGLDKLEDPVKMAEQGIRDLKKDLNAGMQGLAEIKATHIRAKQDLENLLTQSNEYEQKAILLLKKAERGDLDSSEADRLASDALNKKGDLDRRIASQQKQVGQYEHMVRKMEVNVTEIRSQIRKWETELSSLKARSKVSKVSAKVNKQLSQIDSKSTTALLEKMKAKVDEQEALAEAYDDIQLGQKSIDDEIDKALGSDALQLDGKNDALKALKAKMSGEGSDNATNAESNDEGTKNMSDLDRLKQQLKKD